MNKYKTMDANTAVSMVAYKFSEVCGIYPITPASPMAENIDMISGSNELNFYNQKVKVVEMQSEAGAIGLVHGSLQSGILASTFTASQGLLLMIPTLYKLAGECLPAVIHVAARSLSTHALSIMGDHQDIYATRQTGVSMLAASSVEQAYHMAMIAHLSAISSSMPFINFFDGFRTSHEIDKIKLIDLNKLEKLIDQKALLKFRQKAMNTDNPTTRGSAENDDVYFQHTESRNMDYENTYNNVLKYMNAINKITMNNYQPFNYYGAKKAKHIIVAMGSVCETIKETIDYLNSKEDIYGLVEVHLYRPFNKEYLKKVIPKTVQKIAVLDRTKEAGSTGEPLYLDVCASLIDEDITIIGGRYGLSSKNTTPAMIKSVYDNLKKKKSLTNFTIGINDDVTNLSLEYDKDFHLSNNNLELLIYGYGSDGMVSTSKDIIKIIGDNTKKNVQGYFQYDSKKSGGVTRSHIRISDDKIRSTYYVDNPDFIVVSKDSYIYKYDILDKIKNKGTLILNTNLDEEKLIKTLPNKVKYLLAKKKIKFYITDAYSLVNKLGLKNKINTCLEVCILETLDILNKKKINSLMKENNKKRFAKIGTNIVEINNKVVDASSNILKEITIDKKWLYLEYLEDKNNNFNQIINNLKGDDLPVSAFLDKKDGIYKGQTTKDEKRNIAQNVPCWISENCIECNKCVFACPHGVIRPFINEKDGIDCINPKNKKFKIAISYANCTGCGVCASVCPGKLGNKALEMKPYDKDKFKQEEFDYLMKHNDNNKYDLAKNIVRNIGFTMPNFEYSGACAGCGETAYIKNLTQMFNDNLIIANATGCSSIYGSSVPSMPYNLPWASSLFEDNAEYGLGIKEGINVKRDKIRKYMQEHQKEDKLFKKWLDNSEDINITREIKEKIDYKKHPYLLPLKSAIVKEHVFIIGGDGFAYDIGYGGLDHVLSRNEDVNILILDTEVYSNTGGQTSKSSNLGAIASFSSFGKETYKKDLAKVAMCYPHVYVATVNIGYDMNQYLQVLKEASEHKGPSLIIAYSPCIEHGIKTGMEHSLSNAYLATKCGYFPVFRYNPDTNTFKLDSKDIEFDKYHDYLMSENRYSNLYNVNKNQANEILEKQKQWAMNRYEYYKKLAKEDN